MLFKRQRYQKSPQLSGSARLSLALALALGLAGCAGAERSSAPADNINKAGARASAAESRQAATAAGLDMSAATLLASLSTDRSVSDVARLITPPNAREAVISARDAMQNKQWAELEALIPLAKTDPVLGTYAEYWSLRRKLQDPTLPVPDDEMRRFMQAHPEGYLSDRLRGDWIIAAARAGNYRLAAQLGPVVNSNSLERCSRLLSLHMLGEKVKAEQVMDTFQPNSMCWSMLDQLASSQVVSWKDLQQELRATLETSKKGNAQRLAAIMFDGSEMRQYAALMNNPKKWLSGRKAPRTRAETELTAIALTRLAYGDQRESNAAYVQSQWAKVLPKKDMEWVWSQFGLVAALNVELNAVDWYRKSGNIPLTDYNHAWQVRSELRQPRIDWNRVDKAIQRMSKRQASEPVWVYWQGRALAALGNKQAATEHYRSIASELDFYGQLASEELGLTPSIPPAPVPLTVAELKEALENPGLQRAIALFDLGWRPEAVPEWNYTLRGMTDRQLLAAAELARHEHIYDRVVNTSLQTESEIDFSQRFVAPFEGRVTEKAREINLDPAWVYGLIRQESRFITDARSRVGASGLMQLMPATARWVAKKIGMTDFKQSSVNDFDTNTILGTNYLNMVLNDLNGSEVLATAGYNAGPRRPVLWRSKFQAPVEGAIFAETIPFTETRLYVKNVMSNTTYYAMMFTGKPQSLKQRLGTVSPSPNKRVALP
ncbi:transglycosylase SLT domain-containing protein [Pusillimonas sp. MFBS29]|uniref:lytic transglycosylase domain-containing protein n=1 Tax=Pusillimonas sp. MFBS29 TaxID=2886690 RepID=UPI001D118646|nr:transglycosylase SLT domain-containing protein [Pusillimonas sp. MFBS29]MCC2595755.1 transglycosylase SLT domain-containing protein [Pusillimonas sp. MFBS29]